MPTIKLPRHPGEFLRDELAFNHWSIDRILDVDISGPTIRSRAWWARFLSGDIDCVMTENEVCVIASCTGVCPNVWLGIQALWDELQLAVESTHPTGKCHVCKYLLPDTVTCKIDGPTPRRFDSYISWEGVR